MLGLENIGKKFMKGATEELNENPPAILDADRLRNWAEIILGAGLLALSLLGGKGGLRKPQTIVINNYITK